MDRADILPHNKVYCPSLVHQYIEPEYIIDLLDALDAIFVYHGHSLCSHWYRPWPQEPLDFIKCEPRKIGSFKKTSDKKDDCTNVGQQSPPPSEITEMYLQLRVYVRKFTASYFM